MDEKKTFVFVGAYSSPELISSSHLTTDVLTECAKCGFNVLFITPNQVRGLSASKRRQYKKTRTEKTSWGQHHIIHSPFWKWGGPITLYLRYRIFAAKTISHLKQQASIKAVLCWSYPPIGLAKPLLRYAEKHKMPFFYDIHDIHPELDRCNPLFRFLMRHETQYAFSRSSKLLTLSQDMKISLVNRGIPKEKITVIPPWAYVTAPNTQVPAAIKAVIDGHISVMYIGNVGKYQAIDTILEAAEILSKSDQIRFVIVGNGAKAEAVRKKANSLHNLFYFPKTNEQEAFALYQNASINLITLAPHTIPFCCPSKTPLVLQASKPVLVAVGNSVYADELKKLDCYVVEPNATSLAHAVLEIASSQSKQMAKCQNNGLYSRSQSLILWNVFFQGIIHDHDG